MKKKTLLSMVGVLFVLLIALYFVFSIVLNKAVVAGVEAFVPQMTKTSVELDSVSISPFTGTGGISGLVVGNPEGFKSDYSVKIGEAEVSVAPFSILGDRILVKRIYVHSPQFNYERKLLTSNLKEILKNVREASGRPPEEGEVEEVVEEKTPSELKIEIQEFIVEEGTMGLTIAGKTMEVKMPRIVLRDIGKNEGGITPDEAVFEVMSVVLKQAVASAASLGGGGIDKIKSLFGGGD